MIEAARDKHGKKEKKTTGEEGYSMQVAARRSGVSPHLIRMWERRYAAVEPRRTPTGRRVYDEAAIERLRLLNAATQAGHNIGSIAGLPLERLQAIVRTDAQAVSRVPKREAKVAEGSENQLQRQLQADSAYWVGKALDAVRALDAEALRHTLDESLVALGRVVAVESVVAPLMEQTGELWRTGNLRIVHEHLASAGARSFLGALMETPVTENAPLLLVTTPVGQVHEIGALMAAATAVSEGWRALYLGPNLPAEEVALAVRTHHGARALALSLVYPSDDAHIVSEIQRLGQFLPAGFPIFAGGRAAGDYAAELEAVGGRCVSNLQELRAALEELRRR